MISYHRRPKRAGRCRDAGPARTVADLPALRVRAFLRAVGLPDGYAPRTRRIARRMIRVVLRRLSEVAGQLPSSSLGPLEFTLDRTGAGAMLYVRRLFVPAGTAPTFSLPLTPTKPAYGGERWWFEC